MIFVVKSSNSSPVTISSIGGANAVLYIYIFDNGDFVAVGENGLYKHYKVAVSNYLSYSGPSTSGNLRAVVFTDRLQGVIVGDYHANGTYFTTQNQSVSPQGHLENADWQSKPILGVGIDPSNLIQGSINTITI